ncbi:arabinan endo-1,5-alpha-L-arabinosidase [Rhizoctonia solani]|uniref:Arabinan endo-1,5-alpha-L-arabinosidase n=1 Tax=Rhizoctonia solani TaxID=456999 RepID=A0A0K6G5S7_9AGAM|nr:arabinan endo-1,5-alpha-L-arabinosidase [Rhizoctonia solani]
MRFTPSTIVLSALSFVSTVLAYPGPGYVTGSLDVHDPSMCRDSSGKYFLFSTGVNIPIRTSTDRINWTLVGNVWASGQATWTNTYTGKSNGDLWAPDCTYKNGEFYLYYAASTFGSQNSAIFFAKSKTGLPGSWTNQGLVISTSPSNDYNAIDPNLIIDGSNWWLSFGSYWTGIKLVQLGSSTGKPSSSTIYSIARRTANSGAVEAPIIVKNGSYYYLFTSWDNCCSGTSSTYNVRVGRSTSITGPYVDQSGVSLSSGGGTLILASHDSIIGPGGQSVFKDTDAWVIDYHYYTSTGSLLGINLLDFSSGWPVVY